MRSADPLAFRGRSYPMTVITPISPWNLPRVYFNLWLFRVLRSIRKRAFLVRLYERLYRLVRLLTLDPHRRKEGAPFQDLVDLKFIHFARWSIVKPKDLHEALRDHYLIFSTNFNGDWHQYLDAFSFTLRHGLDRIWGTSRGYPGAWPVTPFKEYARRHMLPASYYYNAYPGASVRDIQSACEVTAALAKFREEVAKAEPDASEFRAMYEAFVASVQGKLASCAEKIDSTSAEGAFR